MGSGGSDGDGDDDDEGVMRMMSPMVCVEDQGEDKSMAYGWAMVMMMHQGPMGGSLDGDEGEC